MRMWRNWQTRRFQVPVGDRAGSNPVIRTKAKSRIFLGHLRKIRLFVFFSLALFVILCYNIRNQ